MAKKNLKSKLRDGTPTLGTYAFLSSPDGIESMSRAGLDFIIIDTEHSPKDWSTLAHLVRACELGGAAPIIRVANNHEKEILHALELGAEGIVVPFISSVSDAEAAMEFAFYPPEGRRGVCTVSRAAGLGLRRDNFEEVIREANDSTVVMGQVEDAEGLANFHDLRAMSPGLDALLIGRGDLASSFGVPGQSQHKKVVEAVRETLTEAKTLEGCPSGMVLYSPDEAASWMPYGVSVFMYSVDTAVLGRAYTRIVSDFTSSAVSE